MTVREYFKFAGWNEHSTQKVFLVQAKPHGSKENHDAEFRYRHTSIWCVWEWLDFANNGCDTLDEIVLNPNAYAHDWLSGGKWNVQIRTGQYRGILTASKADIEWYYGKEQAAQLIAYIDKKIRERK